MFRKFVFVSLLCNVASEPTVINEMNVKEMMTSPRHKFVKFFAPWCGHCKKMKPDWDNLSNAFDKMDDVVIADVDCTTEKSICEKYGVSGYPTLKYFEPDSDTGEAFEGNDRSFESLKKWVDDLNQAYKCDVNHMEMCDEKDRKILEEFIPLSNEKKTEAYKTLSDTLTKMNSEHEELLKSLQDTFSKSAENLHKFKEDNNSRLRLLKRLTKASVTKDEL